MIEVIRKEKEEGRILPGLYKNTGRVTFGENTSKATSIAMSLVMFSAPTS